MCRLPSTRQTWNTVGSPSKKSGAQKPSNVIGIDLRKVPFTAVQCYYKSTNCSPKNPAPHSNYYITCTKNPNANPRYACDHHMRQNPNVIFKKIVLTD